jgi:negative regulator of replication initiation
VPILSVAPITTAPTAQSPTTAVSSRAKAIEQERYEQLVQAVQQHRTERVRYAQLVRAVEQHRSAAKARDLVKRRGAVLGAIESLEDEMTQVGLRGSPSNGTETETSSLPHSP